MYLFITNLSVVSFFYWRISIVFPNQIFSSKKKIYHEAYINEHKALENIQKVLENIYLIKILSTTRLKLFLFKTLRNYYSAVLSNFKHGAINNITPNFVNNFCSIDTNCFL